MNQLASDKKDAVTKDDLHIQYADKIKTIKDKEAEVKDLKKEAAVMEATLIERFASDTIDKLSIKGGVTLRLDCKIWPKVSSPELAVDALRKAGLDMLVAHETYQTQALAGYLRECAKNDEPLPDAFKGIIEPNPVYKIIVTRS